MRRRRAIRRVAVSSSGHTREKRRRSGASAPSRRTTIRAPREGAFGRKHDREPAHHRGEWNRVHSPIFMSRSADTFGTESYFWRTQQALSSNPDASASIDHAGNAAVTWGRARRIIFQPAARRRTLIAPAHERPGAATGAVETGSLTGARSAADVEIAVIQAGTVDIDLET
jgi:hypothetical protein